MHLESSRSGNRRRLPGDGGEKLRHGFTLVEMLVVIAIIGILAALITAAAANALWSAKQTKIKSEVDILAGAIEKFKQQYGSYPPANLTCYLPGGGGTYTANPQLLAFVARAFPRYAPAPGYTMGTGIAWDLQNAGVDYMVLNPQVALVFWLSGFGPDPTDPFNHNNLQVTRTPFFTFDQTRLVLAETYNGLPAGSAGAVSLTGTVSPVGTAAGAVPSPYTFAAATPTYGIGQLAYNAAYGSAAYCYFDYQSYGTLYNQTTGHIGYPANGSQIGIISAGPLSTSTATQEYLTQSMVTTPATAPTPMYSTGTGYVMPYVLDVNGNNLFDIADTFCKPTSFQIISAGQDGAFGTVYQPSGSSNSTIQGRLYPGGINTLTAATVSGLGVSYDPPPPNGSSADDDNITNFCERNNLAAAKP